MNRCLVYYLWNEIIKINSLMYDEIKKVKCMHFKKAIYASSSKMNSLNFFSIKYWSSSLNFSYMAIINCLLWINHSAINDDDKQKAFLSEKQETEENLVHLQTNKQTDKQVAQTIRQQQSSFNEWCNQALIKHY